MPTTPGERGGPSTPKRKAGGEGASPSRKRALTGQPTLFSFLETSPSAKRSAALEVDDPFAGDRLSDEALARHLAGGMDQVDADEAYARALQEAWNVEDNGAQEASTSQPRRADGTARDADAAQVANAVPEDAKQAFSALPDTPLAPAVPRPSEPIKSRVDVAALDASIAAIDLAEDPESFSTEIETTHWPRSSDVVHIPYALYAHGFARLNGERSRILILRILTNLLRIVRAYEPDQLVPALYLMSNEIAPSYAGVELGVGGALLQKATMQVSGRTAAFLRRAWTQYGDAGDVAFVACRGMTQLVQHEPLTIGKVYATLWAIARASGARSMREKQRLVSGLLLASRGEERRFVVRTLSANLRIHAMRTTVLAALVRAFVLDDAAFAGVAAAEAEALAKRAYARHPNWQGMVDALRAGDLAGLDLAVGVPVTPMLGSITRSLDAVHATMCDAPFVSEFKYDGQRVQLHVDGERVHIFSRHLETITDKYPDVVAMVPLLQTHAQAFILDAEVVAVSDTGVLPFQTLAGRARKDVALDAVQVRVCVYAFDVLYLDGTSMLGATLRERRAALRRHFPASLRATAAHAGFAFATSSEATSADEVAAFFHEACAQHCEGVMVKSLDHVPDGPLATYEPDKRTEAWLKVKKDYLADLGDALDLVPIGAWHGMGRKTAFWSPILLAVYDPETGVYEAVCKCMSGFSDAFYQELNTRYGSTQDPPPSFAHDGMYALGDVRPAVLWPPTEVWEIRGAEITASPTALSALHPAP
ncbi:hypothetical protein MBRA1_001759 [Malassezia brasiliensis]|uniref:DNA ligase n=1 Tax=Malassezia brasiliensis TaxID=1821822 RepID=A0AAF0IPN3_9BASI|nr:hypothetical protein MBRA1_001759 [Malassezia brasiliensis]